MSAKRLWPIGAVIGATIGLSYLCFTLSATATAVAMLLFFEVLLASIYMRLEDAIAASFTAALCLDYFFVPPIWQITIGDLQGWFSLAVFLAVALLTSNLSARVRKQRDELINQQNEKEKLYALSRAMLLTSGQDVRRLIVNKCIELFDFSEAALFESSTGAIQRSQFPGQFTDEMLKRAALSGSFDRREESSSMVIPISLGNKVFGSFGFAGKTLSETTMQVLVSTVAIALAQAQAQEASSRADAVRQGEELKSLMIDALAHDLKTPLAVMEAATDLLLSPAGVADAQRNELLTVLKDQTTGLRRMIEEAIHLARIEAKKLRLEAKPVSVDELVRGALAALADRALSRHISVELPPGLPLVFADRELLVQALKQLLDNALKYSPPRTNILVSAATADELVSVSVQDEGTGLTEVEQGRVFDKFYRGRYGGSGVQGTGMGLAIAKEIAEAHGGAIAVESYIGKGSRFTITLHAATAPLPVQG